MIGRKKGGKWCSVGSKGVGAVEIINGWAVGFSVEGDSGARWGGQGSSSAQWGGQGASSAQCRGQGRCRVNRSVKCGGQGVIWRTMGK